MANQTTQTKQAATLTHLTTHEMRWHNFTLYTLSCEEGCVSVEMYKKSPDKNYDIRAYICNLWVKEEHRRRGVAAQLLALAERTARTHDHNCRAVWLQYHRADSKPYVFQWYERQGYREEAFGNRGALMKKELA